MISTVFAGSLDPSDSWQAAVLEASWQQASQPGDLFRLAPVRPGDRLPRSRHAQLVATLPYCPHPDAEDDARHAILPAGLLEWLFRGRFETTVLVCDLSNVFRAPIDDGVTPGRAIACPWPDLPRPGSGPFGLGDELDYLRRVCADQSLEVSAVTLPALVHSHDLLRLAPRWLELTMLIREECPDWSGWSTSTHRLAFALALAEWELEVEARPLAFAAHHNAGVQARRADGVREAKVLDHAVLDVPGHEGTVSLNASSAAIWDLIDGRRTVADIARELEQRFDKAQGALDGDVETTIGQLVEIEALDLRLVAP